MERHCYNTTRFSEADSFLKYTRLNTRQKYQNKTINLMDTQRYILLTLHFTHLVDAYLRTLYHIKKTNLTKCLETKIPLQNPEFHCKTNQIKAWNFAALPSLPSILHWILN